MSELSTGTGLRNVTSPWNFSAHSELSPACPSSQRCVQANLEALKASFNGRVSSPTMRVTREVFTGDPGFLGQLFPEKPNLSTVENVCKKQVTGERRCRVVAGSQGVQPSLHDGLGILWELRGLASHQRGHLWPGCEPHGPKSGLPRSHVACGIISRSRDPSSRLHTGKPNPHYTPRHLLP